MAFLNQLRRNAQRVAFSAVLITLMSAIGTSAQASTPTVTPIGGGHGQIAFDSDRSGNFDIYIMNVDGSNMRDLTNNPAVDTNTAWSPDGNQIAFDSDRDGHSQIYVMNADGSNVRRLTDNGVQNFAPDWSPDGKQIVFDSWDGSSSNIRVMDSDGSNVHSLPISNSSEKDDPTWLPNGRQIAFALWLNDGNPYMSIVNTDGSNEQFLFEGYLNPAAPAWFPEDGVKWSLDGTQITLSLGNIYVMKPDGSDARRLTNGDEIDRNPSWSPDGTQIAFASTRNNNADIYTMNVDGSNVKRLTNDPANDFSPAFRP